MKSEHDLKNTQEDMRAINFVRSLRGRFIVSHALCIAIKKMEEEPESCKESSNIEDMKYLRARLFPIYQMAERGRELMLQGKNL